MVPCTSMLPGTQHHLHAHSITSMHASSHVPPQQQKGSTKTISDTTSPLQGSPGHPHTEMVTDTVTPALETAQEVGSLDLGWMISTHAGQSSKPCSTAPRLGFSIYLGTGCAGEQRPNWGRLCSTAQAGSANQSHQC